MRDVQVLNNASGGVFSRTCTWNISRSSFKQNGGFAIALVDGSGTVDRNVVTENYSGISLDSGVFTVTNNIIVRNHHPTNPVYGINIFTQTPGTKIEFNTIADNTDDSSIPGVGLICDIQNGATLAFPSNIIVRNQRQTFGAGCTHPSSIIIDVDITGIKFKSPDAAPYDYRINAGSIAIDAATVSTLAHDFDGEARPQGAARDVGADEFTP